MTQKKRELNRSRSPEVFGKTRIQRNKLSPRHSVGIFTYSSVLFLVAKLSGDKEYS